SFDFLKTAEFLHITNPLGNAAVRHALERRAIIQVLRHTHVAIKWNIFWHIAEVRARLQRLSKNIESGDARPAGSRRHEPRQDAHGRGFAGAVRPEKTHDFALANLEAQILNGSLTSVPLCQILNLDHFATLR